MLQLKDIVKDYGSDDTLVHALKGVSLSFRNSEFVSILGPSGCGKTTMLNIIGGLDRYTSGDVMINNKSTKTFKNSDWDAYRNNYVGFIFQNYNLINHQTILENVELALTLSGINPKERKARAIDALEKVGLGEQLRKKPNQLSGGQMQRVAIARALVNNPEIILADEPTGALDTKNSLQIMELLKEISKERLVIMVTHNDQLAYDYSTRIIKMLDGEILDDSMPYEPILDEQVVGDLKDGEQVASGNVSNQQNRDAEPNQQSSDTEFKYFAEEEAPDVSGLDEKTAKKVLKAFEKSQNQKKKATVKRTSMSLLTAFRLSLKNLFSKRNRTFLTAFAGSIGIIGIALVLAVNNGFNIYIDDTQQTMLGQYPIQIQQMYMDMNIFMNPSGGNSNSGKLDKFPSDDKIYAQSSNMAMGLYNGLQYNRITKDYIDYVEKLPKDIASEISYTYAMKMNLITEIASKEGGLDYKKIDFASPDPIFEMMMGSDNRFVEMVGDEYMNAHYQVLAGEYPQKPNQIALVVNEYNQISKSVLTQFHFDKNADIDLKNLKFGDFIGKKMRIVAYNDWYTKEGELFNEPDIDNSDLMRQMYEKAEGQEIEISAIMRIKEGSPLSIYPTSLLYRKELREQVVADNLKSDMVKAQLAEYDKAKANKKYNEKSVITGKELPKVLIDVSGIPGFDVGQDDNGIDWNESPLNPFYLNVEDRHEVYMQKIGASGLPNSILIYPRTFDAKDDIKAYLNEYNEGKSKKDQIQHVDAAGMMLDTVKQIVDIISIVLVCFASISLVVSSIMIGIITYVSVVERTKEIGVLRAIGARRIDIGNVFNAETATIGVTSGVMGVLIALILSFPINAIIKHFAKGYVMTNIVVLSPITAIILIVVSVALTMIAGLIPANIAAHKDPVTALRSE